MNKNVYFALAVLVLVALACSFTPVAIATVVPATQTTVVNNKVLFQDDFSSTSSGWDRTQGETYFTDYQDGGYRIHVIPETYSAFANPYQTFQNDVHVEVDATKIGGPDDNAFGVICRYQDVDNFYFAYISSDGYVGIGINNAGTKTIISSSDGNMVSDPNINQGDTSNHLEVRCVGSNLSVLVNGTQIASATDTTFSGGDVGLIARTFSVGGTDIMFDNLVVSKP